MTVPFRSRLAVPALTVVIVAFAVGCGPGRVVVPVAMTSPVATPPDGQALVTHEAAVRGISAFLANELGLPVPEHVTVYVYGSRAVFEQGLVRDANLSPMRAAEISDYAVGIGRRRQLLLNEDAYDRRSREWLRLIAHELTHVVQIELAQGEGCAEQWLAEGMAEWVAFTVLERLHLDTVAQRREIAAAAVRGHGPVVSAQLDLATLGSPRGFTLRHLREGSLPTYRLAFLLADYLIAREGLPRVVRYFELCAGRRDRQRNFRDAFGQSLEEFEREALGHLARLSQ